MREQENGDQKPKTPRTGQTRRHHGLGDQGGVKGEEGQAMLEMTVCIIFLLLVVVALFEFAMVFYSYISLLNAAREGAVYASIYPDVAEGTISPHWTEFEETTLAEAEASGLITDGGILELLTPIRQAPPCENDVCTITAILNYDMMNETQGLFLPFMGRLGLFQTLVVQARVDMPIRTD